MSVQQLFEIRPPDFSSVAHSIGEIDDDIIDVVSTKFRAAVLTLHAHIVARSPVHNGLYRAGWGFMPSFREDEQAFYALIANNVEYAEPVTYGSLEGQKPWPNAGPKTVKQGNRIYSSQAPGGVINPILEDWGDNLINEIRDELAGGLGGA